MGYGLDFFRAVFLYFSDGQVRAAYKAANGLGDGTVNRFQFDPNGTVWGATEGGLRRLKSGRVARSTPAAPVVSAVMSALVAIASSFCFWLSVDVGALDYYRIGSNVPESQ